MQTPTPYFFFVSNPQFGVTFSRTNKHRVTLAHPKLVSLVDHLKTMEWSKPFPIKSAGINSKGNPFVQVGSRSDPFMAGVIEFTNASMKLIGANLTPELCGKDFRFVNMMDGTMAVEIGDWKCFVANLSDAKAM